MIYCGCLRAAYIHKMRDEKRIGRILEMINKIWKTNPDQRFSQLLINLNIIKDSKEAWLGEDEDLERFLKDLSKK